MLNHRGTVQYRFAIQGVACASCVSRIEHALQTQPDVQQAVMNFAERMVTVTTVSSVNPTQLIEAIQALGYQARLLQNVAEDECIRGELERHHYQQLVYKTGFAFVIGIPLFFLTLLNFMPSLTTTAGYVVNWLLVFLTFSVLLYSGGHFFKGAWQGIKSHSANMDTLIACGTGVAWLYSLIVLLLSQHIPVIAQHVYFEAATIIIALVNLGALLELRARRHTSEAIKRLMKLQPKTARVIREDTEDDIPLSHLVIGDRIRVRPGEQVPVDGILLEGHSYLDESMLTGESVPKAKHVNDEIVGGTLNKSGSFIFKATRIGNDTVLAQLIALVQQAQNSKPRLARLADTLSAYFVPLVLIMAVLTALVWLNTHVDQKVAYAMVTSLSVIVIACPCALGLAVPMSVMIGVGKGAEHGILIRQGDALQQASELNTIVLDKTGTITQGKPEVTGLYPTNGWDEKTLLQCAASLEIQSEHPLAEAIVAKAKTLSLALLSVIDFQAISGYGVTGSLDKQTYYIGNKKWLTQHHITLGSMEAQADILATRGETPLYVATEQHIIGLITIADPIKQDSQQAIQQLQRQGLNVIMLTGDHPSTARAVAKQIGISDVLADILPQDKAQHIKRLQARGNKVGMVGDGINDAPALAQADVGFAIGTGTDIAIDSAGITLMQGSLKGVVQAIALSKQTIRNMKQNLVGAFIYNLLGIPIAAGILFPLTGLLMNPMLAGLAMALSSVTVVSNANRLRLFKMKEPSYDAVN